MLRTWLNIVALWLIGVLAAAQLPKIAVLAPVLRETFHLSLAQAASGELKGAVDSLLDIVRADREWNDQAARRQLLVVFEAAGATSEIARDGRRRLSSILFA